MNPETPTLANDAPRTDTVPALTAEPVADDRVLAIRDLHVVPAADRGREILRGIDLEVRKGEVHAIMGRNGSGKTTLAYALMGHPAYTVTGGEVRWKGIDILTLSPDKRARMGLFLAFQYPTAIPGLSVASFLRTALNARRRGLEGGNGEHDPSDPTRGGIRMGEFRTLLREKMALLKLDDSFAARYVNEGFSGGEKKRLEMLQMAVLEPEIAILDETDSGLDIDALRIVAEGVNAMLNPNLGGGNHVANHVEGQVVDWCKDIVGLPRDAGGLLVSGGSMANLVGLTVARNATAGIDLRSEGVQSLPARMTYYASTEVHSCVQKALELLGLGARALRKVPVAPSMRPAALN